MPSSALNPGVAGVEALRDLHQPLGRGLEVTATGKSDGKPFQAPHLFLTSLHTTPEALLQLVRDRWSIEGSHWIRDTQLHEDAHRDSALRR